MSRAYLSLGSNLEPEKHLRAALATIGELDAVRAVSNCIRVAE